MKRILSFFCVAFICLFNCCVNGFSVSANSAAPTISGTSASGEVLFTDENCPLQVKKENLTFEIGEFPGLGFSSAESLLSYSANFTAEYTFYNPTDYDLTAKMVFPIGKLPEYAGDYYSKETFDDTKNYAVMINGETVEKKLRYTWLSYDFRIERELDKLSDTYVESEFYSPDMPVYKYEIKFLGEDAYVAATIEFLYDETKTQFATDFDFDFYGKTNLFYPYFYKKNDIVTVYAIGESFSMMKVNWLQKKQEEGVYWDTLSKDLITITQTEQTTFLEFVSSKYAQSEPLPVLDWYNTIVCEAGNSWRYGYALTPKDFTYSKPLRWYAYEMQIPAKGSATNAVSAPIYPTINNEDGYNRLLSYTYKYLLSPAKTWDSFENLQINIRTPYELEYSNLQGFTRVDDGYTLQLAELPDEELKFNLFDPVAKAEWKEQKQQQEKEEKMKVVRVVVIVVSVFLGLVLILGYEMKRVK
ncbi:MAG: hypothetical protein E7357_02460 [Clostridiales bacterium]|nr:hypothetical protein [Clostridiales bacterium]